MVARRGLVAPQNFFLEAVIRRCNNTDSSFILANAQICDYPIVYCNEGFAKMIGYPRAEIMQKNASLSFMYGDHSDVGAIQKIQSALENATTEQVEIGLCKKNKTNVWLLMNISPIMNGGGNEGQMEADKKGGASSGLGPTTMPLRTVAGLGGGEEGNKHNRVVLYLCQFKDITPLKEPLEGENNKMLGLSRILQIARVAKYRQQFTPNHIETKDLMHKPSQGNIGSNFNQLMNLGGDVLPQYRHETPKTSPHIILHYSTSKTVWDWSILALTFYTAFMVPFNIAFRQRANPILPSLALLAPDQANANAFSSFNPAEKGIDYVILLDSVVDVIFFADILLNFHTTFVGSVGEVVIDPKAIRKNYFKSWFLIDLLSCLPYDIFYMFKQDDERIASLFSALKVVRLLRLGRVARKLDNYLEYGAATLLLLLCAYVLVAHWMACIWYMIGEFEARNKFHYFHDHPMPDGWLIRLSYDLKMPFNGSASNLSRLIGGPDRTQCYVSSLYFTMSCMSTVGFGNIASTTMNEKIFGICMMIISALLYAAIFGHMTTIIQQMTSSTQRYHQMISDVREFIRLQEIPKDLAEKVVDYIVSTWTMNKGIEMARVLSFCPKDMRADICVHMNRNVFNEHICFKLMSDGCKRAFATNMDTIHAAPGDLLYHTGESVDALWFVVQGSLEVKQDDEVVAILGKGDVFGDEFWKHNKTGQSACMVQALTYSDLHFIKRESLMQVLSFYKPFANSLARNLVLTYNLTNRMKFRKVLDVKREMELEERRKIEKLEIASDHPIRKLLQRMQERHAARLVSSRAEEEMHLVQNEVNAMMEEPHQHKGGGSVGGIVDKLNNLERMLEALISRQMEECRYAPLPVNAQPIPSSVPLPQVVELQNEHLPAVSVVMAVPTAGYSSNTLYRSTLRNATKFGRMTSSRDRSLSMEKGGGINDDMPPDKPAPKIPPLRLHDDQPLISVKDLPLPPSMINHQHHQQQQHQLMQRQQALTRQHQLPSLERCPCCHSPTGPGESQQQPQKGRVPQIHIERESTIRLNMGASSNRSSSSGEDGGGGSERDSSLGNTNDTKPPMLRRY